MANKIAIVWECQVVQVNDKKQTNGKINHYKIEVTPPMVWFGKSSLLFEQCRMLYLIEGGSVHPQLTLLIVSCSMS